MTTLPNFNFPAIQASGVGLAYANQVDAAPVLEGIDLQIQAGEVVGLLGKSGAGKTSLLRVLGGLIAPTAGRVEIFGHPVSDEITRASLRVSLVENSALDPCMPIGEIFPTPDNDRRELLRLLGLAVMGQSTLATLGQLPQTLRDRAGLARAFSNETTSAGICLIDELPGLDLETAFALQAWLPDWAHGLDQAILLASRHPAVLTALCDRIVILRQGRLVHEALTRDLERPGGPTQYRIRLKGRLEPGRASWFPDFQLSYDEAGDTLIQGELRDQPALHGLLGRIRDIGLALELVERLSPRREERLRSWL